LRAGKLPRFDCPPPNFEPMPPYDRGWTAIAKAVVDDDSKYYQVIRAIHKHKPEPQTCINKNKRVPSKIKRRYRDIHISSKRLQVEIANYSQVIGGSSSENISK